MVLFHTTVSQNQWVPRHPECTKFNIKECCACVRYSQGGESSFCSSSHKRHPPRHGGSCPELQLLSPSGSTCRNPLLTPQTAHALTRLCSYTYMHTNTTHFTHSDRYSTAYRCLMLYRRTFFQQLENHAPEQTPLNLIKSKGCTHSLHTPG